MSKNYKIVVSNIPKALIKPYGKDNKGQCVVYASPDSESGYASVSITMPAKFKESRNQNVMDLELWASQKLIKSVKKDGKYTTSQITAEEFRSEFQQTYRQRDMERRRDMGRGLINEEQEPNRDYSWLDETF